MKLRPAALLSALCLLLAPLPAAARGELQAGPTLLEIAPGASATRLRLGNSGDSVVSAQVRVYAWSQKDGEDTLAPSDHVVASPPIAQIEPGGEQVVRIVLAGPPASGSDLSFRVVVDELPAEDAAGESAVKVRMRYLIPAFVRAPGAGEPVLNCSLTAGGTRLACRNDGERAARLGATALVDGTGQAVNLSEGLFGYVLPGSTRHWDLPKAPAARADGALKLDTQLNGQAATVVVHPRP